MTLCQLPGGLANHALHPNTDEIRRHRVLNSRWRGGSVVRGTGPELRVATWCGTGPEWMIDGTGAV